MFLFVVGCLWVMELYNGYLYCFYLRIVSLGYVKVGCLKYVLLIGILEFVLYIYICIDYGYCIVNLLNFCCLYE